MAVCENLLPPAQLLKPCTKPCTQKNPKTLYEVYTKRPCSTALYDNLVRNLVHTAASGSKHLAPQLSIGPFARRAGPCDLVLTLYEPCSNRQMGAPDDFMSTQQWKTVWEWDTPIPFTKCYQRGPRQPCPKSLHRRPPRISTQTSVVVQGSTTLYNFFFVHSWDFIQSAKKIVHWFFGWNRSQNSEKL